MDTELQEELDILLNCLSRFGIKPLSDIFLTTNYNPPIAITPSNEINYILYSLNDINGYTVIVRLRDKEFYDGIYTNFQYLIGNNGVDYRSPMKYFFRVQKLRRLKERSVICSE